MKISQKRTCYGCRAVRISDIIWCDLGYPIEMPKGIPMKPCPKPRTIKELVEVKTTIGEN